MSASFHEVQFPTTISYGAVGGPGFQTTVLTLSSGYEKRNQDWSLARAEYDVTHALKHQSDLDVLIAFFYARRGRAYGFRFKDWSDFNVPDSGGSPQLFFTTDGSTRTFQLTKTYVDAGGSYVRTISKPVAGTLALFNAGVATSDFTVDTTTGIVTLGTTTAATTGNAITGSCQFDVPVRFDIDKMESSIADWDNYAWGSIKLVEVRDL